MTCRWTGVCGPVLRKVPSSDYRNLRLYPFYDEFWWKTTHLLLLFTNFWITHRFLRKICRKKDPYLENLGPKTHPYGRHIPVPSTCYVPPGVVAGIISLASISVNLAFTCIRMNELSSLCISLPVRPVFKL